MIITAQLENGHIAACKSEDGLAIAVSTPFTTLSGEFWLTDATGRSMWRGIYQDRDGFYRNERVPEEIWASAVKLTREWSAHQGARETEARNAVLDREAARYGSLSEKIAQDMDRANSDL